jgi:hypothetical protein
VAQPTYDPIIESLTLPRFRIFSPLRPPKPGTALVLVPYEGPAVTIRHGEVIPAARTGTYHHMFTVDVSEHWLALYLPLLSKDAGFAFRSRIGLICRVAEPAEVVARGIRDVSGALYDHMKRMLREISREYDIGEFHEAERALNTYVRTFTGDSAIRLRNVHVELLVDEDEVVTSGREFRKIKRETRLGTMRRDRHLASLDERGVEAIIAEIMEREGPRAALELIASMDSTERAELVKALDTVLKHSDAHREPYDLIDAERAVVDRIVGGSAAPFGGIRSGRLRGTLAVATAGDARTTDTDTRPELSAGSDSLRHAAASSEPAKPPVYGKAMSRGASAPPEDEPVGSVERHGDNDAGAVGERLGAEPKMSRVRGTASLDVDARGGGNGRQVPVADDGV